MSCLICILVLSVVLEVSPSFGREIVDSSLGIYNRDSWRPVREEAIPVIENRVYSPPIEAQDRFFFGKKEDEHHDEHGYFDYDQDYDYGYHHHFLDRYADEEYGDYQNYENNNEGFSLASFVGNILNWS